MKKTASKTIFLLTSAIIGIIALISVYLILISTGVIKTRENKLIISAVGCEKEYDGTALYGTEYQIIYGSLLDGHSIEVYFSGSQTEVGNSECEVSAKITDEQGADVTKEYSIESVPAQLIVTKRSITISSGSREKYFDNTPLYADPDEFDVTRGSLLRGHNISVSAVSEITKVGSVENVISATITDNDEKDVTANYNIEYIFGNLSVLPNELSVKALSDTFVFDGEAHTESGYVVENGKSRLAQLGHVLEVEVVGEITYVGKEVNRLEIKVLDADGVDVSNYWSISTYDGTLEVIPRPIQLYTKSYEKIYDGTPLNSPEDGFNQPVDLVSGHVAKAVCVGTQTDVGASPNSVSDVRIVDVEETDVTDNYEISYVFAYVTVNPINVVVKTYGGNWTYDGTEHTNGNWDFSGALVEGHDLEVNVTGAITEIGTAPNDCFAKVLSGTTDVSSNYKISYIYGDLIVHEQDLTIYVKTPSLEVDYDGLAHYTESSQMTVVDDSALQSGHTIDLSAFETIRVVNAGTYQNKVESFVIYDAEGNDVSSSYSIGYKNQATDLGRITINKKVLGIKTYSASKNYDGTALTKSGYEVIDSSALVSGQTLVGVNVTGSQKIAGKSRNTARAVVYDNIGNDVSNNYACDESYFGILEVLPITVQISITESVAEYEVGSTVVSIGSSVRGLVSGDTFVNATYLVPELEGVDYPFNTEVNQIAKVLIVNSEGENVSNCYVYELQTRWVRLNPIE